MSSEQSWFNVTPYINLLDLSSKTQKRAEAILTEANRAGLSVRKTPESLIAAALYVACILEEERRTQKQISQVTGVSLTTIQVRYRELVHKLDIRSR